MGNVHDFAILGATAAGWTAAATLAGAGFDTVLLKTPRQQELDCPLSQWIPQTLVDRLTRAGMKNVPGTPFNTVRFYDSSLKSSVVYSPGQPLGHFIPADRLNTKLQDWAQQSGAAARTSTRPATVHLYEDRIELAGTRKYTARILLIAQGHPVDVLESLGRKNPPVDEAITAAGLDIPLGKEKKQLPSGFAETLHITETPSGRAVVLIFTVGGTIHLRTVYHGSKPQHCAEELTETIRTLQAAGILPESLNLNKATGAQWTPVAGIALEQEIHEAKRCLLIGTAGGFSESITGHSLTPSIISALLAAAIASRAIDGEFEQTRLMTYKKSWRKELAEYLHPPGTSVHTILPLLFVNEQLVDKFGRAVLYGEKI